MSKRNPVKRNPSKKKPGPAPEISDKRISQSATSGNLSHKLGLICALFALLLYANTFNHSYTVDDGTVIENNSITTQGISALPEIFSSSYRKGFWERKESLYRPLSVAMFAIEWELAPEEPMLGHVVNILLYAATAWFLFKLLVMLFGSLNLLLPFLATLIFISHPLHTEVVANIKSRDEILGFLFSVLCLIYLLQFSKSEKKQQLALSALFLFLGLISKESVVTMMGIIPLTLFFFSNLSIKKIAGITAILSTALLIYFGLRFAVLGGITEEVQKQLINNSLLGAPDLISRYATAFWILGRYLLMLLFPITLCFDYSYNQIPNIGMADYRALLSIAAYLALLFYAIKKFASKDLLAYAIFFYLISISLVSNLVILLEATMGERFVYTASLGYAIGITALLSRILKHPKQKNRAQSIEATLKSGGPLSIVILAIVSLYSFKTVDRNLDWKNNLTLLKHDVETSPNSARIRYAYGSAIVIEQALEEDDETVKNSLLDQGIVQLERGVEILDTYSDAYYHLAIAYKEKNDLPNAIKNFEKARQNKTWRKADFYIASGIAYGSAKIFDKAIDDLNQALVYSPNSAEAYNNLGIYYCDAGRYQESFDALNNAIELDPENAKAYYNIGNTYAKINDFNAAIESYQTAINMKPDYTDAYNNIGNSYASMQNYPMAIEFYKKVIELEPNNGKVLYNIGITYNILGDESTAQQYFQRAKQAGVG